MSSPLVGVLLSLALLLGGRVVAAPGVAFVVTPQGRDSDPGTHARPFATLERARDAVRAARKRAGKAIPGGVTVWIGAGTYRRTTSFVLGPEDSGSAASPTRYLALPGTRPRLVGGVAAPASALRHVTDPEILRRLDPAARAGIRWLDLRALGVSDLGQPFPDTFRGYAGWPELFLDGHPMRLARWPNDGFARIARIADPGSKPRWNETPDRGGAFIYEGDRPERWTGAGDVFLDGYWAYKWYNEALRVASIDTKEKRITFVAPHRYGLGGPSGGEYVALNLLEELDAPGEYYLDRKKGRLYVLPPTSLRSEQEILLSLLEKPMLVVKDASQVTVAGLTFEASRGLAVQVDGGSDVSVAGCTIRNLATDAVQVTGGTRHTVTGCDISAMGGGGIVLKGGDRATLTPCGHVARNNHIHHFGRLFRTHRDAINLEGVGCRAAHNLIHDAPHHAIDFGGNDHVIEFNEIHDVCLETDDAGAIYTGRDWTVRGTIIANNFFYRIGGGPSVGNQAIYLDDTACGTVCEGNVVYQVNRAFLIGGGRDNVVRDNVIVDCPIPVHIDNRGMGGEWAGGQEVFHTLRDRLKDVPYRSETWRRRYPELYRILDDNPGLPKGNVVTGNLIVRSGAMSLAPEAQQYSRIENNRITAADPGFVDAPHLDFRLRPGVAPSIPFPRIGLVRDRYRKTLPLSAPWIEPAAQAFVGEVAVTLATRAPQAAIRYTLDGTAPTPRSLLYRRPIVLTRSATVTAAAFGAAPGERSAAVSSTYTLRRLARGEGIALGDLTPVESFLHGSLLKDTAYNAGPIRIGGRAFTRGLITHPEVSGDGGLGFAEWELRSGLAKMGRFTAWVGIDDSAAGRGSAVFLVLVRRSGRWVEAFRSEVLRGGMPPVRVDVPLGGADRLRLSVTDAGDSIDSDHAAWGDPILR